jgi:hypothetical protein
MNAPGRELLQGAGFPYPTRRTGSASLKRITGPDPWLHPFAPSRRVCFIEKKFIGGRFFYRIIEESFDESGADDYSMYEFFLYL